MRDEGRADISISREEMQRCDRNAGRMQDTDGFACNQRRLLGGFRDNSIAGPKRRANLAEKDRKRKIPRADANKYTAPTIAQLIGLAGRPRHCLSNELPPGLRCVKAAQGDGLAGLRDSIVTRLA